MRGHFCKKQILHIVEDRRWAVPLGVVGVGPIVAAPLKETQTHYQCWAVMQSRLIRGLV